MARITVEDCFKNVESRFELVMVSAQRARELASGSEPQVDTRRDKHTVTALREIAIGTVDVERIRNTLIMGYQNHIPLEDNDEIDPEILEVERELSGELGDIITPDIEKEEVKEDGLNVEMETVEEETEAIEDDEDSENSKESVKNDEAEEEIGEDSEENEDDDDDKKNPEASES